MSTTPLRPAMVPVSRRMRAYFAPIDRNSGTPAMFDPSKHASGFQLDAPPAPWVDLGWVENVQRSNLTTGTPLTAGPRGVAVGQFRGPLQARVEFEFREWGKLQMALANGSEQMNVLASDPNADAQASGGNAVAAIAVLGGSTASEIVLGMGAVDSFNAGDLVAVDVDYQQQTGYVGNGISAAYVNDPVDVNRDANYVRRVTFNVGRVAQKTATSLVLAQALLGGAPVTGSGAQKVLGFVDREMGGFFQDWSGLLVAEEDSGGRIYFYYPHLSPVSAASEEAKVEIAGGITALALKASFLAMGHRDENDGQMVICYRSYFPTTMAGVY